MEWVKQSRLSQGLRRQAQEAWRRKEAEAKETLRRARGREGARTYERARQRLARTQNVERVRRQPSRRAKEKHEYGQTYRGEGGDQDERSDTDPAGGRGGHDGMRDEGASDSCAEDDDDTSTGEDVDSDEVEEWLPGSDDSDADLLSMHAHEGMDIDGEGEAALEHVSMEHES